MSAIRRPIVVRRNPTTTSDDGGGIGLGDRVRGTVASREGGEVSLTLADGKTAVCPATEISADATETDITLLAELASGEYLATTRAPIEKVDLNKVQPGDLVKGRVAELKQVGLQLMFDGARGFAPARMLGGDVGVPIGFQRSWFVGEVLEVDRKKKQIIAGVRKAIDRRDSLRKRDFIQQLKVGSAIEGTITRMNTHGAFIDIGGGVEGLVHESKLLRHMKESDKPQKIDVGEKVTLEVIQTDPRRGRIALGFASENTDVSSWKDLAADYTPGEQVTGMVEKVGGDGAVVLLEEKIRGTLTKEEIAKISEVVRKGQLLTASVISIDEKASRIRLAAI